MESDLRPRSSNNILFKYADDTNLLVPEHTDVDITYEYNHIKQWARNNRMVINVIIIIIINEIYIAQVRKSQCN